MSEIAVQERSRRKRWARPGSSHDRIVRTLLSILLSVVDFVLHIAVAIWVQVHYKGEHDLFWAAVILAMVANLAGIVVYIARNVGGEPPDVGTAEPSPLMRKFSERPEECVVVLMLGIVNTECLCFLSAVEEDQMRAIACLVEIVGAEQMDILHAE